MLKYQTIHQQHSTKSVRVYYTLFTTLDKITGQPTNITKLTHLRHIFIITRNKHWLLYNINFLLLLNFLQLWPILGTFFPHALCHLFCYVAEGFQFYNSSCACFSLCFSFNSITAAMLVILSVLVQFCNSSCACFSFGFSSTTAAVHVFLSVSHVLHCLQ